MKPNRSSPLLIAFVLFTGTALLLAAESHKESNTPDSRPQSELTDSPAPAGPPADTPPGARSSEQAGSVSRARIGTYDSRCLAMAYYRSEMFKSRMRELEAEYEKAKSAGDKKRVKEMEARSASGVWPDMGWPQRPAQGMMIHKQAFSTWPVDNILERIKGKIPDVAKQAGVDVIISKWDLTHQRAGVELVDVTPLLVKLIADDEKALENALKVRDMTPLPREKLMDPHD